MDKQKQTGEWPVCFFLVTYRFGTTVSVVMSLRRSLEDFHE